MDSRRGLQFPESEEKTASGNVLNRGWLGGPGGPLGEKSMNLRVTDRKMNISRSHRNMGLMGLKAKGHRAKTGGTDQSVGRKNPTPLTEFSAACQA